MALNPQEPNAMFFAADYRGMNEDRMLTPLETEADLFDLNCSSPTTTGENGGENEFGDTAGAGPLPASAGNVIIDSERGPLPWVPVQPTDTNVPAGESAPHQAQRPGLEPVAFHSATATARTPGSRQVRIRSRSPSFHRFLPRHRGRHAHEEPFVLTNPFNVARAGTADPNASTGASTTTGEESRGRDTGNRFTTDARTGAGVWLPVSIWVPERADVEGWVRVVYINFVLLHLPALYFTRVAKVFEDARVSKREVERVAKSGYGVLDALAVASLGVGTSASASAGAGAHVGVGVGAHVGVGSVVMTPPRWTLPTPPDDFVTLSPALQTFKESWETFIDSLLREWKTLNLVSALLLTAILTLFQLPGVNTDPVSRNTSFLSLVCALMSLSYGCVYTIRFGSLRSISRALSWADEAEESKSSIWWSVWVFLAIPAVWLAWSMLWFIVTILAFVWRSGANDNLDQHPPLSFDMALAPRIIITAHFVLGLVYFVLIVKTLQTYGTLTEHVASLDSGLDIAERGEAREVEMTEGMSALGLTHIRSRSELT